MKQIQGERGFSLVELLSVLGIIGILASIAMLNYTTLSDKAWDTAAETDYRNIKVAMFTALADPSTASRFVIRNRVGPTELPSPLDSVVLSEDTQVDIFHDERYRRNRANTNTTRIYVWNRNGNKEYRYTNVNGSVTEQVITR